MGQKRTMLVFQYVVIILTVYNLYVWLKTGKELIHYFKCIYDNASFNGWKEMLKRKAEFLGPPFSNLRYDHNKKMHYIDWSDI